MKNVLVIGLGEIGSSMSKVLEESGKYKVFKKDIEHLEISEKIDIMHICIPFFDKFIGIVEGYIKEYNPELVIINSTVRPGTTQQIFEKIKKKIVHSPVRGKHPNLKEGILQFVKFIGPVDEESGKLAKDHFESLNIKTELVNSPVESELAKLFSTTYYGLCIAWHQEMERFCRKFDADFENTVTKFNKTYNDGCKTTNPDVVRPVLYPGFIGGHCVMPNIDILKKDIKSDFLEVIGKSNEKKKKEK